MNTLENVSTNMDLRVRCLLQMASASCHRRSKDGGDLVNEYPLVDDDVTHDRDSVRQSVLLPVQLEVSHAMSGPSGQRAKHI